GEYFCLPASKGLSADLSKAPAPVFSFKSYGRQVCNYRLEDCPAEATAWLTDQKAVRWSPKTNAWTTEAVQWDHRHQLAFFCHDEHYGDHWTTQRVYMEVPAVRMGKELLHVDYWTGY